MVDLWTAVLWENIRGPMSGSHCDESSSAWHSMVRR